MFRHIYVYRLKCLLKDKMMVFWTVLFPIVLATFFSMAFSNIGSGNAFSSIPIAIVGERGSGEALAELFESAGDQGGKLFAVTYASEDLAQEMLDGGDIAGYVLLDGGVQVVVKESGYGQTILKEFTDSILQGQSAYMGLAAQNPTAAGQLKSPEARQYIKETGKTGSNIALSFFYALIAMAAMYGSFWGNREIEDIQADITGTGMRVNIAPVHKLKALFYSACAAITIHFASLLLLIAYIVLVLGIDFSGSLPQIALVCFAGSFAGVSLGALLGALSGKNDKAKNIIVISVSMVLSFLAGLMVNTIKFAVTNAVPLLGYINPANLISDALYALYYYGANARFFMNIGLLFGLSAVFILIVYFVTRRQKYASL